jgi:hypothetical protein
MVSSKKDKSRIIFDVNDKVKLMRIELGMRPVCLPGWAPAQHWAILISWEGDKNIYVFELDTSKLQIRSKLTRGLENYTWKRVFLGFINMSTKTLVRKFEAMGLMTNHTQYGLFLNNCQMWAIEFLGLIDQDLVKKCPTGINPIFLCFAGIVVLAVAGLFLFSS